MDLAGQDDLRQPSPPVQQLDDGGYIMVVLLIGIAVSAVWMGALLPSWRQQAVRQKEAELIFRGEEYARAIALYWRKNNQLPPSIDVLVSQRYLRKKYLDPITSKEFLTVGGLAPPGGLAAPSGGLATNQTPNQNARGLGPPSSTGNLGQAMGARAGISGVRSTSTATSIVVYRGQTAYSQFPFDYIIALQKMGNLIPLGGEPNAGRGRGRGEGVGGPMRGDENIRVSPGGGRMGPPGPGSGRGDIRELPVGPRRGP